MMDDATRQLLLSLSADLAGLQARVDAALRWPAAVPEGFTPAYSAGQPVCIQCGQTIVGKRRDAKICDAPACQKAHKQMLNARINSRRKATSR